MLNILRVRVFLLLLLAAAVPRVCPAQDANSGSIASSLQPGDLVSVQGGTLRPFDQSQLAHARFVAIYYSASWCPPCRGFTPSLVKFYDEIKPANPQFELILVCRDQTAAAMAAYMKGDQMQWPALTFAKGRSQKTLNRYAGDGIPDLVLVDAQGKVLADSYVNGQYMGPQKVVQEIKKILKQNPPTADEIAQAKTAAAKPAPASGGSNAGSDDFDTFFKKPAQTPAP